MKQKEIVNFRTAFESEKGGIFRSAHIDHLSRSELYTFYQIHDIECHIDLRNQDEVTSEYSEAQDFPSFRRFPLSDGDAVFRSLMMPSRDDYVTYYKDLIRNNRTAIKEILSFISFSSYSKFLISCYAGKDRTGVIIALLLLLLGQPIDYIAHDYHKSHAQLKLHADMFKKNWEKKGLTKMQYMVRLEAQSEIISILLKDISSHTGSFNHFFFEILHLKEDILINLKRKYLV